MLKRWGFLLFLALAPLALYPMLAPASFSTTAPRNDYTGNGATATYTYSFRIFASSDLKVTKTDTSGVSTTLTLTTDYTVTGVNSTSGGTITLTAGNLPSNYLLTIRFQRSIQQATDLRNQGGYFASTHENKFDETTRYAQQLQDQADRSLKLPETEAGTAAKTTLPTATSRASKFLGFDSSGNPIAAAGTSADLTPVSAFINTLLDDATAVAARQTLLLDTHGADIASAGTLNLDAATGDLIDVTGTTTITAVTLAEGVEKTVRFTGALTLTHGASLVLPGSANITTAAGDVAVFRGYASSVVRVVTYQKLSGLAVVLQTVAAGNGIGVSTSGSTTTVSAIPRSYLAGLAMSTAGSSATLSIAAGQATDSTNAQNITLAAIAKTTSAWAVGTGNGCLDTGAIANSTWYHFYAILRTDTGVTDVLCSTSASAPTMPTSYSFKRRIGSGKTDGSAQWIAFTQTGDWFYWVTPTLNVSVTNQSTSAVSRTLNMPTGFKMLADVQTWTDNATWADGSTYYRDPDSTDSAPSTTAAPLGTANPSIAGNGQFSRFQVMTNTSAAITTRAVGASSTVRIVTMGWMDRRGRDD